MADTTRTKPTVDQARRLVFESRKLFNTGVSVLRLSQWLAVWLYLAAGVLLVLKVTGVGGTARGMLPLWIGATGMGVVLTSLIVSYRQRYSMLDAAAWLDLRTEGGGTLIQLVTSEGDVRTPNLTWDIRPGLRYGVVARRLILPVALATAVVMMPWKEGAELLEASLDSRAETVEKRVEKARKLGVVREAEARAFKRDLERARAAGTRSPEAGAESIDTIDKRLDQAVLKRAKLSREALDAAEKLLAEAENPSGPGLPSAAAEVGKMLDDLYEREAQAQEVRRLLKRIAEKMGLDGAATAEEIMSSATSLESLDAKQLKEIARALRRGQFTLLDKMARSKGLLSGKEAKAHLATLVAGAAKAGGREGAGTGQGTGGGADAAGAGHGGVARGPGEAPLRFGNATDKSKVRFKARPFERGGGPLPGIMVGKRRIAGGVAPPPEFQTPNRSGVVFDGTEGGSQGNADLGPRGREVTRRYFTEATSDE